MKALIICGFAMLLLVSCAPTVPQADYDAVLSQIADLESQKTTLDEELSRLTG